jgi:uncharacterized protein (TIGR03663 family)
MKENVEENVAAPNVPQERARPDYLWLAGASLVTAIAAFLRFFWLELKPFHHDEGVNGFFLTNLVRDGIYKYDPANYHGPTLYYIALPFANIFGLETVPMRVSVAIFGVLTVVLALYLWRYIGKTGSILAALFIALSPGMVYISRYFIHEVFFVFLSLAIVVSVLFFIEKRSAGIGAVIWIALLLIVCFVPSAFNLAAYLGGDSEGAVWTLRVVFLIIDAAIVYFLINLLLSWDEGRPIYLLLASACVSLFFATKETAFITLGTMIIACLCIWAWRLILNREVSKSWAVNAVIGLHVIVIAAGLYFRETLIDGGKWLYNTFPANPYRPPEHFVVYSIIFLLAVTAAAWVLFLLELRRKNDSETTEPVDITWKNFRDGIGDRKSLLIVSAATGAVFIYVSVLFFSSFFTYAEGIGKAFEAYAIWTKTGNKDHTQNGYFGYLKWGMKVEAPILIISSLGILISLFKGRHRVAMFTGLWGLGLFLAYTIIPYKTPWLALSYLLPLCIIAGYAIGELSAARDIRLRVIAVALAVSGFSLLGYQTYQHNFVRYDDEEMPYVYAHTRRGFLDLIGEIERYAEKSGKGKDATIEIVSPEYWPMTWYLLKYSHANFHGRYVPSTTAEIVITKKNDQDATAIELYSGHYKYAGVYPLRPGVNLVLLVRNDLADSDDEDMSKLPEYKPVPGYTN